jgi:hypothetical protein
MVRTFALPSWPSRAEWRDLVLPKEHGSWSLALEPLAFGLLAAPSPAGAWFAVAVIAGFFARRPLRIAWRETRRERREHARVALAMCSVVAATAMLAAVSIAGVFWLRWLVPSAVAGAVFIRYDLRNASRDGAAEVIGAAAFALLPAAFAALAGAGPATALALAIVMCGRAVPTVLTVRGALRGARTGEVRPAPALVAALAALGAGVALAAAGLAPWITAATAAVFLLRATIILSPRVSLRARTIGMIEAALGVAFVLAVGIAWRN